MLVVANGPENESIRSVDYERFDRLCKILKAEGAQASWNFVDSIETLSSLLEMAKPSLVLSCVDHLPGKSWKRGEAVPQNLAKINVHDWFEKRHIAYVGSTPDVIELALSKSALKEKFIADGILTPEFRTCGSFDKIPGLTGAGLPPFPCIIKPLASGNSRGIADDSVVFDEASLHRKIGQVQDKYPNILIEQYLGIYPDFREFTCACIGNDAHRRIMPAEIVMKTPKAIPVVTNADKEGRRTAAIRIDDAYLRGQAVDFASRIFRSAGIRDYSRCDMVYAGDRFWAIEVNGQPMIPDDWFKACSENAGLSESQYLTGIFIAALERLHPDFRQEVEVRDEDRKK